MQKKVLSLHDLAGFGRSSLVPIIAVLSAMGHQCVPVPTAVFSTHTALPQYTMRDLTDSIPPTVAQYEALGLRFEAVYSGFLNGEDQIASVSQAILRLQAPNGVVLVDPVMGDNGKIYKTYTPALCRRMSDLCHLANVITPNLTEAAILQGKAPDCLPRTEAECACWAHTLEQEYGAHVVLTGIAHEPNQLCVLCCEKGQITSFEHTRIAAYYPGTGDIFSAVLLGSLLHGASLSSAAERAASFVQACIAFTEEQGENNLYGVQLEPLLSLLFPVENA